MQCFLEYSGLKLLLKTLNELSLCQKLKFFISNFFKTSWCKPLIFQTLKSLKYQRSATSCCKGIGIRKIDFVAKTQILSTKIGLSANFKKISFLEVIGLYTFLKTLSLN